MIMKVVSLGWDPSIAQRLGWLLQLSQMWITWLHNFCLGGSAYAHAPTHLLIKFWRGECPHVTVCFDIVHSYLPSPRGGQIWLVWHMRVVPMILIWKIANEKGVVVKYEIVVECDSTICREVQCRDGGVEIQVWMPLQPLAWLARAGGKERYVWSHLF